MLQVLKLQTRRTLSATVFVCSVRTIEILGVCKSKLQLACPRNAGEQLRMRYPAHTHRTAQLLLYRFLPYNFPKKQGLLF